MKIIEALKKIKHLDRKIAKTIERIGKWCAYIEDKRNTEPPLYNKEDIGKMQQQIADWTSEKLRLRARLHETNVVRTAEFRGKNYSIDHLLLIQAVALPTEKKVLERMTRQHLHLSPAEREHCHIVMQYDPKGRDKDIDSVENEMEELNTLLDKLTMEIDLV